MKMPIVELDRTKITIISQVETAIAELRETYMGLAIAGPEDRKGYLAVSEARKDVKARRVKVEHARKALKEDALAYGRLVDGEAKRITAMLEPIEQHLQEQEDGYEASREAIKRKAAAEAQAKLQARVDALGAVGGSVSIAVLQALTDEQFAVELSKAAEADNARKAAKEKARIERERQEEEARKLREAEEAQLAAERAKLEAERKAQEEQARIEREKLEDERRMQAEAQRKIDAENNRLAAERQRIEREEFERQAKAKAEQEAREKLERERVEQERLAKEKAEREAEEAKRREAMKPDLEKLRDYVAAVEAVPIPDIQSQDVRLKLLSLTMTIEKYCGDVETWIDEQGE